MQLSSPPLAMPIRQSQHDKRGKVHLNCRGLCVGRCRHADCVHRTFKALRLGFRGKKGSQVDHLLREFHGFVKGCKQARSPIEGLDGLERGGLLDLAPGLCALPWNSGFPKDLAPGHEREMWLPSAYLRQQWECSQLTLPIGGALVQVGGALAQGFGARIS
jgi:hypothetical protein